MSTYNTKTQDSNRIKAIQRKILQNDPSPYIPQHNNHFLKYCKVILTTFFLKIQLFLDMTLVSSGDWFLTFWRPSGILCPAIKCHIPEDLTIQKYRWESQISQLLMPWIWQTFYTTTDLYFTLKPHLWNVSALSSHHSLCPSHPKLQLMTAYFSHLSDIFERVWRFMTLNWDPPPTVLMPVLRMKQMQPDKTCSSLQGGRSSVKHNSGKIKHIML